jgi:geranylgeranyl diphosphate synthase type I
LPLDLESYRSALDGELREVFSSRQGFLYDLLRYHLGWTDRQGLSEDNPRPATLPSLLPLVSCEALTGDFRPALPAAAGVDLVYNFTLVHGDVQAARPEAQDRPSVWWVWGPAQAINAGDGLHALGRIATMGLAQNGVPAERVLQAVQSLDRACLSSCEGQYLDLEFQDRMVVTTAAYFDMIERKTGALTGCAAESGALAAGVDAVACEQLGEMGRKLGMAWQLSRDIADLWGGKGDGMTAANVLGKKKSLPLIYAMETSTVAVKRELGAIYAKRVLEPEDVTNLLNVLDRCDARSVSEGKGQELATEALGSLDSLGLPDEATAKLQALARMALRGEV